ncbi:recombinase family protein [Fluviispira sanaruensis]|uniref:Resolvase n=1 Tax=Fluviispira sanaruensis TaxID=2493639 RepID=A0A4P2VHS5_FLUSA|nr:recombinase family protein [Fluviispira sanaruensis]BBH52553.1 resolvase [Fluviispira sanaruensis]
MKVAIYSKNDTVEKKMPQKQKNSLNNYIQYRGWKVINEFVDHCAVQQKKVSERNKIMQLAKEKEIDVVLVWSLKCWAESTCDLILSLNELTQYGVSFVSLSESLDSSTPTRKTFTDILTAFAKFEKEKNILHKQNLSIIAKSSEPKAKRLGKALKCAEQMRALQQEGKNHSEIARILNVSRGSVHNILGNISKNKESKKVYKRGEAQTLFCQSFIKTIQFLTCHARIKSSKKITSSSLSM